MRSERIYLLAVCNKIGVNGIGPHKHNDWLSFELCVNDLPIIVDPGTYCYTGNMEFRRLFRSTAYHNTVVIDGEEQFAIHNCIFALIRPHGNIKVLNWESGSESDLLEAEHTGYTRLPNPVVHRRRFLLDKNKNQVEITDTFIGKGKHTIEWCFHLDVGLECKPGISKALVFKNRSSVLEIELSDFKIIPEIQNGWVSRSYNQHEKAKIIYWKKHIDVASKPSFTQKIYVHSSDIRNNDK